MVWSDWVTAPKSPKPPLWSAEVVSGGSWSYAGADPVADLKAFAELLKATAPKPVPVRWRHVDELSAAGRLVVGEWLCLCGPGSLPVRLHAPFDPDEDCWLAVAVGSKFVGARLACCLPGSPVACWRPHAVVARSVLRCEVCCARVGVPRGVGSPVLDKVAAEVLGLECRLGESGSVGWAGAAGLKASAVKVGEFSASLGKLGPGVAPPGGWFVKLEEPVLSPLVGSGDPPDLPSWLSPQLKQPGV